MRLNSELWVKAYLRTVMSGGAFAAVAGRGDQERGAVFIKVSRLDGTAALFVPAPTGMSEDETGRDRLWLSGLASGTPETEVDKRLTREREFDSDIWVVEVEDREGRHFLDDWLVRVAD